MSRSVFPGYGPLRLRDSRFFSNYPAYEPCDPANNPRGSIGEYVLDPTTRTVLFTKIFARDLMSYCGPSRISPYHYRALPHHPLLDPRRVPPVDGEGVGTGIEVWADLQDWEGEHRVVLRARDEHGTCQASATFFVTCSGHRATTLGHDPSAS